MTRERLLKWFGGLALLTPLSVAVLAEEKPGQADVQIYATEDVVKQAAVRERQTEEPPAPQAAACNGEAAAAEKGYLMEKLDCTSLGPWLECHKTNISGFLDQGFTWNPDRPANRFNFPQTFNDRSNEYQMNQLYLTMERPVDPKSCGWDFGGRVDLLYGSDYYFTTAVGLETHQDGSQHWNGGGGPRFQFGSAALYGLALPQAYAEIFAPIGNGLDIKIGHFYTPVGYEVVNATGNFFYSHAYTHQYFEPFTHTGVLAAYDLTENLKVQAGLTLGWDTFDDTSDKVGFLAGLTWTSCDKNTSLFYGIHVGEEPGLVQENGRIYQSVVLTRKISENLTSVTGSDLGYQNDGSTNAAGGPQDAEFYSLYQYFIYQINKCWSAGLRFEWSRDDDNLRIVPVGGTADGASFYEITAGLNYKPFEHVRIRPEVRWDWSDFNLGPFGAYDDFSDNNQFTAAFDVILTF